MSALSLRRRLVRLVIVVLALALGSFTSSGTAPVFSSGNFDPATTLTLSSHAPGANADTTSTISVPGSDVLGDSVTLTPQAATISASPGTIPTGLGDAMGTLASEINLGLSNGACNSFVAVNITLLSASIDNSAGNLIYPSLPTEADAQGPLSPLRRDTYTVSPGTGSAGPGSAPSDPANGLPSHVDRYPAFLNTVFDPDGAGTNPPLAPLARYSGSTVILTSSIVLKQVVVFSPGVLAAYTPPALLSDLADPTLGYASIVVTNDPTAAPTPGDPITDICSPVTATSTLYGVTKTNPCAGNTALPCNTTDGINSPVAGAPTGRVRYANPTAPGTYQWYGFQTSARDLDNDGYENSLDSCPYTTNVDNPKTSAGADGDMLDGSCDPTPNEDTNAGDHDGDGFTNAADNCPLVPNPTQAEGEANEPANIASPRGGSTTDSIGDECDGFETACGANVDDDGDGVVNDGCPTVGSALAETTCTFSTSSEMDNDLDGWPNDGCPVSGTAESGMQCNNFIDDDSDALANDGCPVRGGPEQGCLNKTDDDGDGAFNDGCPSSSRVANGHYHTMLTGNPKCIGGTDADGDGWCATGQSGVPNDPHDSANSLVPETWSQSRFFLSSAGTMLSAQSQPESACGPAIDDDGDGNVNDGCPSDGAEDSALCSNVVDDDGDGTVNDGCPLTGNEPETGAQCSNSFDDDADGSINDGCPEVAPEVCGDTVDNDGDSWVNDGCPAVGPPETGAQCNSPFDDDGDGVHNDGCPSVVGDPCSDSLDNDNDGTPNDGCPAVSGAELGSQCANSIDDDSDGFPNDGCPVVQGGEPGGCGNSLDDDGDGLVNDGCPPYPPLHANVCSDGIDNDGDTRVDLLDGTSTVVSQVDDCRPPDSISTTGLDTDGDGSRDLVEIYVGSDPLSRCNEGWEGVIFQPSRAWPWDLSEDGSTFRIDKVNVGDLGTFVSQERLNKAPGETHFDRRWDLRPGSGFTAKWINIQDLAVIITSTPVPMFGVRAFGFGSLCSSHPIYGD